MTAHSRLAPSSAFRWVECPGSVQLSEQFPTLIEDPSAAEGEAAHWVAYSMLKTHTPAVGEPTPNGLTVTDEMLEGARLYVNHIFKLANPHGGLRHVTLEERVTMPSIHPEMFGTPDARVNLLDTEGLLIIGDYKFGHSEVDPFENWQLISYARGVLDQFNFDGAAEAFIRIELHVVQPRCYTASGPIRTWATNAADLRAQWNRLSAAAHEALDEKPSFKVGEWCKYCPGRRACDKLKRTCGVDMDRAPYSPPVPIPLEQTGLELAYLQRAADMIAARITGLQEQAEFALRQGQSVPGVRMAPGRSSLKWSAPVDEVLQLGQMLEIDLAKPADVITPTQAIKKGVDSSVIDAYAARVPGKMCLELETTTLARKVFGQ